MTRACAVFAGKCAHCQAASQLDNTICKFRSGAVLFFLGFHVIQSILGMDTEPIPTLTALWRMDVVSLGPGWARSPWWFDFASALHSALLAFSSGSCELYRFVSSFYSGLVCLITRAPPHECCYHPQLHFCQSATQPVQPHNCYFMSATFALPVHYCMGLLSLLASYSAAHSQLYK